MSSLHFLAEMALMEEKTTEITASQTTSKDYSLEKILPSERVLREKYTFAKEVFETIQKRHQDSKAAVKKWTLKVRKQEETRRREAGYDHSSYHGVFTSTGRYPDCGGSFDGFLLAVKREQYLRWLAETQADLVTSAQAEATALGQKFLKMRAEAVSNISY